MLLQTISEAADTLSALPYFSDIGVFSEDLGDPSNSIDLWLAQKTGIGVQLITPKARVTKPDKGGNGKVYFDDILFSACVWENVKLNRAEDDSGTDKAALDVAEVVAAALHHHQPSFAIENLTLNAGGIVLIPHSQLLGYRVNFTTQGGVDFVINQVITPLLDIVDNGDGTKTVTITCGTPYALIYATSDGSYPAPLDSAGTPRAPYSVPLTVPTGSPILVRAWLPGLLTSKLVSQTV